MIPSCFTSMTINALLSYLHFQTENITLTRKKQKTQQNQWVIYQYSTCDW